MPILSCSSTLKTWRGNLFINFPVSLYRVNLPTDQASARSPFKHRPSSSHVQDHSFLITHERRCCWNDFPCTSQLSPTSVTDSSTLWPVQCSIGSSRDHRSSGICVGLRRSKSSLSIYRPQLDFVFCGRPASSKSCWLTITATGLGKPGEAMQWQNCWQQNHILLPFEGKTRFS